jgi:cytochrome b involved in lipid metabolism
MKTQTILFVLGTLLVVGLAIFFMNRPEDNITPNTQTTSEQPVQPQEEKPVGLTRNEVAMHATKEDCYTIVGGKVYNVTSWISQHPGGAEAILGLCGTDGTQAFSKQHGSNEKAQAALASFFIANVTN